MSGNCHWTEPKRGELWQLDHDYATYLIVRSGGKYTAMRTKNLITMSLGTFPSLTTAKDAVADDLIGK